MSRRLWVSLGALALGTGLLATTQLAGAARGSRQGGILRVGTTGASVQIDPQLAYISTAWWLEDATAAMLYTWSSRGNLRPDAAARYAVSDGGRTYTFTIRRGLRFSDGTRVTARSFAYAIDRLANKQLGSPGAPFITAANGTNIVGALRVTVGEAQHVSGVVARGRKLVIRLVSPDPTFLSKLAMPFFQATSTTLPPAHEVIDPYPSAGRYAFTYNEANVLTSIRRNPFWSPDPRRPAPRNLAGVDVYWNRDANALLADVRAGRLDEDVDVPPAEREGLAAEYGVDKGRFRVRPSVCIGFVAFNNRGQLFRGNVALRKAVNYAVDRTDYAAAAGPYAGRPSSHLLPPSAPGSAAAQPYPPHADLARAASLARGHLRGGKITVYYRSSGTVGPAQGELVRRALVGLGFAAGNVTMKGFSGGSIYTAIGAHWADADLAVSLGWCGDMRSGFERPDPAEFLGLFLDSSLFSVDDAAFRTRFDAARRLHGRARLRALGKLDLDLTRELAPAAVTRTFDGQFFFSDRVDPRSLAYQAAVSNWSIGALALK